ncbi:Fe-S protein assembly co-chaperone HscB [Kistimonas asteriae]|uniref:Fe-S protein assembly co-chaperone HscB n=1 Tax=Kistimonas asteriae TaxID=517724 RepID=UPI001BA7ECDF|nr:Fe-S protein assembly co-chaperone HscB [Kistimonas asteriae]
MSDRQAGLNLQQNYFELFQMPVAYDVDHQALDTRYRELQKAVHPDRFAVQGEQGQRLAVQYAAFVNQAYDTLRSALSRAIYLLELEGVEVNSDRHTVADSAFLMQQMELRDELMAVRDSADPEAALAQLLDEARQMLAGLETNFVGCWAARAEDSLRQAANITHKMHFLVKFIAEAEQLEEELLDY